MKPKPEFQVMGTLSPGPVLDVPPLRRAVFRGLLFGVVCVVVFGVVLGEFELTIALWGISIGLLAAPLALLEGAAARRPPSWGLHVIAAALCGGLAAVGVALGFLQVNYTEAVFKSGSLQSGMDALPRALGIMQKGYFMAICVSFGAPFGLVALGRLREWHVAFQTVSTAFGGPALSGLAMVVLAANQGGSDQDTLLLLTGGFFVCGFHVAFIGTHLPGYITSCNLAPLVGATALSIIGFFNILGGLAAGVLGSRYRLKYLLSGIYLARAVAISLFLLGPKTDWAVYLFSGAFGLLWLSTVPLTSALVGQIFGPRYMATLFGIVMLGHQLGAFFGAWFGGLSYDLSGSYDAVWIISVLLGLLAAVLHWPIADKPVGAVLADASSDAAE